MQNMNKAACLLAVLLAVPLMGCDSGGGGDGASGSSTIQGNVDSVAGGSAVYRPERQEGWRAMFSQLTDLLLPRAWAAVEGVTIRVAGTELVATTADDGSFIISGVPAGNQTLIFSYGSTTSSLDVNVPANATIKLRDLDVASGSVDVGSVEVEIEEDPNANGNDDDDNGNYDNGNDDNDNDDNGNDDDDNGNDDNDNDDNGNDDNDNDDNDNDDNDND